MDTEDSIINTRVGADGSHRIADIETERDVGHKTGNHNVQADHEECVLQEDRTYMWLSMTCLDVYIGKEEYIYGRG